MESDISVMYPWPLEVLVTREKVDKFENLECNSEWRVPYKKNQQRALFIALKSEFYKMV